MLFSGETSGPVLLSESKGAIFRPSVGFSFGINTADEVVVSGFTKIALFTMYETIFRYFLTFTLFHTLA